MTDLSIIIVNWNTRDLLKECLASIFRHQPDFSLQVIVVDNASGDGSREMIRQDFSSVQLIENPDNFGYVVANNQGGHVAKGRFLLFLNPPPPRRPLAGAVAFMEQRLRSRRHGLPDLERERIVAGHGLGFSEPAQGFRLCVGIEPDF